MPDESDGNGRAARLREELVDRLVKDGTIVSPRIAQAMRTVPRHAFAPGVPLDETYAPYDAVVTKRDRYGVAISSVSAPQIQAMMLEQADVQSGMRVLEIGSGGYNAALIAELVGDAGEVVTVDIDAEVVQRAGRLLAAAGYTRVRVLEADAGAGVPEWAPYDRIIVTAGAWDVPPAWRDQLASGGRLVVPLRMNGLTRSLAFERSGDRLVSRSMQVCGFVPMQGAEEHREELLLVRGTGEIGLRFDEGLPAEPHRLDNAVRTPREECWAGVTVGRQESFDTLQLYLATVLPGFCVMSVDPDLDTGLVAPANRRFALATVSDDSFAYLTTRPATDDASVEFGVHAFGPGREQLAAEVAGQVRAWDREQRGGPGPRVEVFPAGTPDGRLRAAGRVLDKKHSRVAISWPSPSSRDRQASGHTTPNRGE